MLTITPLMLWFDTRSPPALLLTEVIGSQMKIRGLIRSFDLVLWSCGYYSQPSFNRVVPLEICPEWDLSKGTRRLRPLTPDAKSTFGQVSILVCYINTPKFQYYTKYMYTLSYVMASI